MEQEGNHIHKFIKTEIPSTCTERGYTLYRCECGAEHKESFKPLAPHDFVLSEDRAATCTEPGERIYKCSVCGENKTESIPPLGHKYGEWQTHAFATCTEEGQEVRICTACGIQQERTIKPKGHKLTNPQSSKTQKGMIEYFCENCGETVILPSSSAKFKAFLKKKSTIAFISIFAFIAVAVASLFIFAKPIDYAMGKIYLNIGNYTKAYYRFIDCRGYRDTDEILDDFMIRFKNTKITFRNDRDTSIQEDENTFDEKGNCVLSVTYDTDDYVVSKTETEYDSHSNPTLEVMYDEDGEVTKNYYEYEYDSKGNMTLMTAYSDGKKPEYRYEYEYDTHGRLTGIISQDLDTGETKNESSVIINSYSGDYKTVIEYDSDGNLVSDITYDSEGNITEKYEFYKDGDAYKSRIANIRQWDRVYTVKDGILKNIDRNVTDENSFDKNGSLVRRDLYTLDGELCAIYEYEQECDENKIPTKFTETRKVVNGDVEYIVEYIYSNPVIIYNPKN